MVELVQPIIVAKDGSHEETIWLTAKASIAAKYSPNNKAFSSSWTANFDQWLQGRFTKSVRRASHNELVKVAQWAEAEAIPYGLFDHNNSAALALPPMAYEDYPKFIAKLQVQGTDFERRGIMLEPITASEPHIYVAEELTTGKAAAQASHALWMLALQPSKNFSKWEEEGFSFFLHLRTSDWLKEKKECEGVHAVIDAGLTEVQPNTLTALSSYSSIR